MITTFIKWLREDNNKQLANDIGLKTAFENLFDFWDLVDKAPIELHGKKDKYDISLDVLWAEEQIDKAFDKA